jgi:quercetin dioxygenase-like cupin family protein
MADARSKYVRKIDEIPLVDLGSKMGSQKVETRLVIGKDVMISFIEQQPGASFPEHSHENEQILIMLEGTEDHLIDGEIIRIEAGDVVFHPPGVPHGGSTSTGYKGIDIFCPPREDYKEIMRESGVDLGKYTVDK